METGAQMMPNLHAKSKKMIYLPSISTGGLEFNTNDGAVLDHEGLFLF